MREKVQRMTRQTIFISTWIAVSRKTCQNQNSFSLITHWWGVKWNKMKIGTRLNGHNSLNFIHLLLSLSLPFSRARALYHTHLLISSQFLILLSILFQFNRVSFAQNRYRKKYIQKKWETVQSCCVHLEFSQNFFAFTSALFLFLF